jgi:Concanavalin A-like lectin/glucanases superfamily
MARVFTDAGGQSLESPTGPRFDFGIFSVAFWVFRTGTPAATRRLVGTIGASGNGWAIQLLAANTIQAAFGFTTTNKARNSTAIAPLNAWVHVVAINSGANAVSTDWTFYIDGKLDAGTNVSSGSGSHQVSNGALSVGKNFSSGIDAPPAIIGGPLALWRRVLSASEALALAAGTHPNCFKADLVAIYGLDGLLNEEEFSQQVPSLVFNTIVPGFALNRPITAPAVWPQIATD